MRTFLLLAAVTLVAGCAQYQWQRSGATQQDFITDKYNCEKDMRQSGYYGTGLIGALEAQGFAERCMEARGYRKVQVNQLPAARPDTAGLAGPENPFR